jgi:hypothetical protein
LLGGVLPIHSMHLRRAQGLMWGPSGAFLPAAAMVGYGCVGQCWPLEADVRLTYCRNSRNCLRKYFFHSYVDPIYSWHLTWQLNKEDLDLCTFAFSWFLCPVFYGRFETIFEQGEDWIHPDPSENSGGEIIRQCQHRGYTRHDGGI